MTALEKTQRANADLSTEQGLPQSLTLVHNGGPLGPILVTATGLLDTDKIVERKVQISFPERGSIEYEIRLERVCKLEDVECDDDETCKAGKCGPIPNFNPPAKSDAGMQMISDAGKVPDATPDSGPPDDPDTGVTPVDSGSKNRPPVCTIATPADNESFSTSESIDLSGMCIDPESGMLAGNQVHWTNSKGDEVGTGRTMRSNPLAPGSETLTLCATNPDDDALPSKCDSVRITIISGAPQAVIEDVHRGADKSPPFAAGKTISFRGSGTGFPQGAALTYLWHDSVDGDFGTGATASLKSPAAGSHTVTFTVTDGDTTKTDTETFLVIAGSNDLPVQPFDVVNEVLDQGADALAVDSTSQALAASGADLYRFQADDLSAGASSAFNGTPTPAITTIHRDLPLERPSLSGDVERPGRVHLPGRCGDRRRELHDL